MGSLLRIAYPLSSDCAPSHGDSVAVIHSPLSSIHLLLHSPVIKGSGYDDEVHTPTLLAAKIHIAVDGAVARSANVQNEVTTPRNSSSQDVIDFQTLQNVITTIRTVSRSLNS